MNSTLKYYYRAKELGVCVDCGKPTEKTRCEECAKKRAERLRERYYRLKEAGICTRCGKRPHAPGKTLCEECLVDHVKSELKHQKKLKDQGLCARCRKPSGGKKLCKECMKAAYRRQRERLAENNTV